eukprot:m51a1_g8863 hypothetical protein (732) ;mRNA; f:573075-575893
MEAAAGLGRYTPLHLSSPFPPRMAFTGDLVPVSPVSGTLMPPPVLLPPVAQPQIAHTPGPAAAAVHSFLSRALARGAADPRGFGFDLDEAVAASGGGPGSRAAACAVLHAHFYAGQDYVRSGDRYEISTSALSALCSRDGVFPRPFSAAVVAVLCKATSSAPPPPPPLSSIADSPRTPLSPSLDDIARALDRQRSDVARRERAVAAREESVASRERGGVAASVPDTSELHEAMREALRAAGAGSRFPVDLDRVLRASGCLGFASREQAAAVLEGSFACDSEYARTQAGYSTTVETLLLLCARSAALGSACASTMMLCLWLEPRQQRLLAQQQQQAGIALELIERRRVELEARERGLADAEQALCLRASQLDAREGSLRAREADLQRRADDAERASLSSLSSMAPLQRPESDGTAEQQQQQQQQQQAACVVIPSFAPYQPLALSQAPQVAVVDMPLDAMPLAQQQIVDDDLYDAGAQQQQQQAQQQQGQGSACPHAHVWWRECLATSAIAGAAGAIGVERWETEQLTVTKGDLYDAYRRWSTETGTPAGSKEAFWKGLRQILTMIDSRPRKSGVRVCTVTIPPIEICREMLKSAMLKKRALVSASAPAPSTREDGCEAESPAEGSEGDVPSPKRPAEDSGSDQGASKRARAASPASPSSSMRGKYITVKSYLEYRGIDPSAGALISFGRAMAKDKTGCEPVSRQGSVNKYRNPEDLPFFERVYASWTSPFTK